MGGAQNNSKVIIAVFLDFQRSFETIDPKLLVNKLKNYGVRALDWFDSYLSNRRQVVKIDEIISNELNNNLGIPQGSILGPLIFNLYINNISECLKFSEVKIFADDTLVYIIADTVEASSTQKINEELNMLYIKLCENKLKLNEKKKKQNLFALQTKELIKII